MVNLKHYAFMLLSLIGTAIYAQDYYFKTYPQIDPGLVIADLDQYKDDIWVTFKGSTNYPLKSGVAFYKLDGLGNLSDNFSPGSSNTLEDFSYNLTSTGPEFLDGKSWFYGYSKLYGTQVPPTSLSWVNITDDLQFSNTSISYNHFSCPIAKVTYNPSGCKDDTLNGDIPIDVSICAEGNSLDRIDDEEFTYLTYISREYLRADVGKPRKCIGAYKVDINPASTISKVNRATGQFVKTICALPYGGNKAASKLGLSMDNRELLTQYYENGELRIVHYAEIPNSTSVTDATGSFGITIFDENLNIINRIAKRLDKPGEDLFGFSKFNDPIGLHIINDKIYAVGNNGGIFVFDKNLVFIKAIKLISDNMAPTFLDSKIGMVGGQPFIYLVGIDELSSGPMTPFIVQLDETLNINKTKNYNLGNYHVNGEDNIRMYTLNQDLYLSMHVRDNSSTERTAILKDNTQLIGMGCELDPISLIAFDLEEIEEFTMPKWVNVDPKFESKISSISNIPTTDNTFCCTNEILDEDQYHFCNSSATTFYINANTTGVTNFEWFWNGGSTTTSVPELSTNILQLGEGNKLSVRYFKDGCWVIYQYTQTPTVSYFALPTYSVASSSANNVTITNTGPGTYQVDIDLCYNLCEQFMVDNAIAPTGWTNIGSNTSMSVDGWYCPFGTNLTEQVQYDHVVFSPLNSASCLHTDVFTVNVSDQNCLGLNSPAAPPTSTNQQPEITEINLVYHQAQRIFTSGDADILNQSLDMKEGELIIYDNNNRLVESLKITSDLSLDEILKSSIQRHQTAHIRYLVFNITGTTSSIRGKILFED